MAAHNKEKSSLSPLSRKFLEYKIRRHLINLNIALQNYPLQQLLDEAKGKAIESRRVEVLEERATRVVLAELRSLIRIAVGINDAITRAIMFSEALPLFIQSLGFRNGEWSVRRSTVQALGVIWGDNQIIPLLEFVIDNDKTSVVRQAAVRELSNIGGFDAIQVLVKSLAIRDESVREIVIEALVNKANRRYSTPALESGLKDPDPFVRHKASDVLDMIDWHPRIDEFKGWYAVAKQDWAEVVLLETLSIPALESALRGKMSAIREKAAYILSCFEWTPKQPVMRGYYLVATKNWEEAIQIKMASVSALVNALDDDNEDIRHAAYDSLVKIGPDAVSTLVNEIRISKIVTVQKSASKIIGLIAKELPEYNNPKFNTLFVEAIPVLAEAVRDSYNRVLMEPAEALADIAENVSDKTLIAHLFAEPIGILKEISYGQHTIVRQNLETIIQRIHKARTESVTASKYMEIIGNKRSSK